MREFEEIKAEVFRRSEERIRKRKRNRRIVLSCVPVVVCALLGVGLLAPRFVPTVDESAGLTDKGADGAFVELTSNTSTADTPEDGSVGYKYVSAEIEAWPLADFSKRELSDPEEISRIAGVLQSFGGFSDESAEPESDADDRDDEQKDQTAASVDEIEFRVTLTASDGAQTVYTLIGNALCNRTEGTKVTLTDAQMRELKVLLGTEG